MHPVEEYQNYNLDRGWVEWVRNCDAHKKKEALNYYITQWRREVSLVWRPDPLVTRYGRENQHPEKLGPRVSGWPILENEKDTTLMAIRAGVNMLQFCSVSNSLSHTTLSNKVRGIFFLKDCVSRHYCVVMILHAYVDVYVLCVCIVGHSCGCDYTNQRFFFFSFFNIDVRIE